MAPERGFEPRTLRLTARCTSFRILGSNSLSAAEYRHVPPFISCVAVRMLAGRLDYGARPHDLNAQCGRLEESLDTLRSLVAHEHRLRV